MSEIKKMYENAGIEPDINYVCDKDPCEKHSVNCQECSHLYDTREDYPDFTAEKQLEIENVILQNKKNYNKWIEYNINVYGEWVIRFVRTDKFAPYIALGKTRAEAFANVINHFWQDLTEEEKQQVKGILE